MPIIKGDGKHNLLYGTNESDQIYGLGGDDIIISGEGKDLLDGGTGADEMYGHGGDDTYIVDNVGDKVDEHEKEGHDTVQASITYGLPAYLEDLILTGTADIDGFGNSLDNHIYGNSGDNDLYGAAGNDELHGGRGNDKLFGGIGNDTMFGGLGADTMTGGQGDDVYYVDQSGDKVIELNGEGKDTVHATVSYTLSTGVETLFLDGHDKIDGGGNDGNNSLYGNDNDNMLFGYGGRDLLIGYGGADAMFGGDGDDAYSVSDAGDSVHEFIGGGFDTVFFYGDFAYTLSDYVEVLYLNGDHDSTGIGNFSANRIYGSVHNDVIDGGLGQDRMEGDAGDDKYYVDDKLDVVVEDDSNGNDTVYSAVDYTLAANIETLSLEIGNAVRATGNDQHNTIFGNAGDNELDGGGGNDILSGLGGNDTFVFHAGQAHGDVVYEFEGNSAAAGDALQFHGYGTAAQGATFIQQTATEWLITSADGLTQEVITLIGGPTVDASDYVFV